MLHGPTATGVKTVLNKTVFVAGRVGERRRKGSRIVVIANHQVHGHVEPFYFPRKPRVCLCVAPMGHVTGQDNEIRVAMIPVD